MYQQLLGCRYLLICHRVPDAVKEMEALRADIEQLHPNREPVVERSLAQVMQVGLGGIEGVAAGPVNLIDAYVPEKGISGVTDQQQVTPLAHLAVVVDPFLRNCP